MRLTADLEANYMRFLSRVVEAHTVWVLTSPEGKGAVVDSNHRAGVVELAFSDAVLARRVARAEWSDYSAMKVPLPRYLEILDRFDDRLVIPDPNADLSGVEVEPRALAKAIKAVQSGVAPDLSYVVDTRADGASPERRGPRPADIRLEAGRLLTGLGVSIQVAKPWRVVRNRDGANVLTYGKHKLNVFAEPIPNEPDDSDDGWTQRWHLSTPTELGHEGTFRVHRELVRAEREVLVVSVSSSRWTPAFIWLFCRSSQWHLRFDSELARLESDRGTAMALVSKLVFDTP